MARMHYPATEAELEAGGYRKADKPQTTCSGRRCQAQIEWWTTPRKEPIPMHRLENGRLRPHYQDCPDSPALKR